MLFSRTKGWIGIDIGTHLVKVAQVQRRGSRVELVEALSVPRQEPWEDQIDDGADVPSSLEIQAALSLGSRFRGQDAAVTLPMAVCDVRTCAIEGDTDAARRAAVLRELDSVYSDTQEPREFDFWTVDVPGESVPSAENAIALSVESAWASRVGRDMSDARLTVHVLDGLPLAVARAIALGMPQVKDPIAAVDWGHNRATLCLVKRGRPLFVRGLRGCGFQTVTRAVARSLGVTTDEAQQLLHSQGLPNRSRGVATDLQAVIEEVAREPLDRFVEELTRTTSYLTEQRRSLAPSKVVLLGGGAAVKNMASYLDDRIEIPVEAWSLDSNAMRHLEDRQLPIAMFGPAIALSALAWGT